MLFTSAKEVLFSLLFVRLPVCLLATLLENFWMDLREIFKEVWQWANEQMVKFWWWSGSVSEYRDCFPDLSLLGDTESGIRRLCCTTLQCGACTSSLAGIALATMMSLHHQPTTDRHDRCDLVEVCTVPVFLVVFLFCFTRMLSSESLHESVGRSWGQRVILPGRYRCFELWIPFSAVVLLVGWQEWYTASVKYYHDCLHRVSRTQLKLK